MLKEVQKNGKPLTVTLRALGELHTQTIDITPEVTWEAYNLPGVFHQDPADRILIATARLHDLRLLTADDLILRYEHVKTVAAKK